MNSANRLTLLMLVLAAASTVLAMVYYPWAELVETDAAVGKPLFEEYSADQVRGIDITSFDSDRGTLNRIQLARRAEKWVVPARQDFIATNSQLTGTVVNALNDRTVYQVISENQQDHIKYGVVDPAEYTIDINVASLGRKLVLNDRNSKPIASLIVGSAVKNSPGKRYVRVPGKPRVYMIDFDDGILTTEFAFWVSPNALQLKTQPDAEGLQFRSLQIDNYQIDNIAVDDPIKNWNYRATVQPIANQLAVKSLTVPIPDQPDAWKRLDTTPEQEAKLKAAALSLSSFFIDDVRRKKKELAGALQKPDSETDDKLFAELPQFGFAKTGFEHGHWNFAAKNGQIAVAMAEGVRITVSIGDFAGENSRSTGKLNYYVMINAAVDHQFLPEPMRPVGLPDDESEQNRAFRRTVEVWSKATREAQRLARELNALHGDWFYLISEEDIANLRPEIPLPTLAASATKERTEQESPAAIEESSESADTAKDGHDER